MQQETEFFQAFHAGGTRHACADSTCPRPVQSLWLMYGRLVGFPTAFCGAAIAMLHQAESELRDEPTHWLTATMLVVLFFTTAWVLWCGMSRGVRLPLVAAALISATAIAVLGLAELCDIQHSLFLVALAVNLLYSCAIIHHWCVHWKSKSAPPMSTVSPRVGNGVDRTADEESAETALENNSEASDTFSESSQLTRPQWAKYAVAVVLWAAVFIYMIVVPTVGMVIDWIHPSTAMSREMVDMTLLESLRLHTVSGVVLLIFLVAGASIGSFLNVVIYRLPRYRALLWPPSACPNCKKKITGKDNVPILAWLRLGGRCRNCHVKISARYPLIEALVGAIFVIFYYRELLSGGANLPIRIPNAYHGIVWILLYTKWDLVTIYLFHTVLLITLLAWGMINYDRFPVPLIAVVPTIAITLLFVTLFPHLNPMLAAWQPFETFLPVGLAGSLSGSLLGCTIGVGLAATFRMQDPIPLLQNPSFKVLSAEAALLAGEIEAEPNSADSSFIEDRNEIEGAASEDRGDSAAVIGAPHELYGAVSGKPTQRADVAASLALVGASLGWQAVLIATVFTLAMMFFVRSARTIMGTFLGGIASRQFPITLGLFASVMVLLLFWSNLYRLFASFS